MYFDAVEFGKRMRDTRLARGLMQEDLAERLNTDKNYISRLERGVRTCSIDLLEAIKMISGVAQVL